MNSSSASPGGALAGANVGTLRLLGALAVLFGHSWRLSAGQHADPISKVLEDVTPFRLGLPGIGVAMFFVLSGFLVTRSYVLRGSLIRYTEARLLRILPALWVVVALTVLAGALISSHSIGAYATNHATGAYALHGFGLFDVRYVLPGVFETNPDIAVNGSLWTLPVELHMYLFVAIAGLAGVLRSRALFNVAAVALVAVKLAAPDAIPLLDSADDAQLALFFVTGAALFVNRESIPLRGWAVVALTLVAALGRSTDAYPGLFALAFAYGVLWVGWHPRLRLPDLAARGDLSYGTYLYAFPVTQLWATAIPDAPWALVFLTTASVLPCAWLSWHLVEERALGLKGRISGALESASARRAVTDH